MAEADGIRVEDVINVTTRLHADLMTAQKAEDPAIIHASTIAAVEGLLGCVRALASAIVKIEVEGVGTELP